MVSGCAHTSARASCLLLPPFLITILSCLSDRAVGVDIRPHPGRRVAAGGYCCLRNVHVSLDIILILRHVHVQRAGLQGHRPNSCCMAAAETRWALPEGAEGSLIIAWLDARFGYCVIQCRQRSTAFAGESFLSPAVVHSPRGLGAACLYSSNCFFLHPGLDCCLQIPLLAATWSG